MTNDPQVPRRRTSPEQSSAGENDAGENNTGPNDAGQPGNKQRRSPQAASGKRPTKQTKQKQQKQQPPRPAKPPASAPLASAPPAATTRPVVAVPALEPNESDQPPPESDAAAEANPADTNPATPHEGRRRWSALTASLVVHVLVLLAAAWALQGVATSKGLQQGERPVDVVLFNDQADQDQRQVEQQDANASTDAASAASAAADASEQLRPESSQAPPLSDLLPKAQVGPQASTTNSRGILGSAMGAIKNQSSEYDALLEAERKRLKARANQGPAAKMSLFGGSPSVGRSFVFVVDRSKSMGTGTGALYAVGDELHRAIGKLDKNHLFQVVAYHHQRRRFGANGMLPATAQNREKLRRYFGSLPAFGRTDHFAAIMSGLLDEPDVLYLMTDGDEPPLSEPQMKQVRNKAGSKTTIHCIHFGYGQPPPDHFMKRLAEENGGKYSFVVLTK